MGLFLKGYDVIKVGMIYVSVNTEQPFQNCLCYRDEVPWKRHTYNTQPGMQNSKYSGMPSKRTAYSLVPRLSWGKGKRAL